MERFKSQLNTINTLFERAREWADLSNCLQKLKKAIDQNPKLHVPLKKDLAKRLAQCLNPDLNVIHLLTIEVYAHIFARELVSKILICVGNVSRYFPCMITFKISLNFHT